MRYAFTLLVLVVLFASSASAQSTNERSPLLQIEPALQDGVAGGHVNVTVLFSNPLGTHITWSLGYAAKEAKVSYERWEISLAPGATARVNATITLGNVTGVVHDITVMAQETPASARAAGRNTTLQVKELAQVRIPASATTGPAQLSLSVHPAPVQLPRGGNATARLVIENSGAAIDAPKLEFSMPPGVEARAAPSSAIPAGSRVEVELFLHHTGDDAVGSTLGGGVGIRTASATTSIAIVIGPSPIVPLPPPSAAVTSIAPQLPSNSSAFDSRVALVGAVASVAGLWTSLWLTRRSWWPFLLALYTRLKPSSILEHPIRRHIVELVQQNPGITFGELARRLDIAPGQLTHHARMLERAGIVFSSPDGQSRRFFHVRYGRPPVVTPLAERAVALVRQQPRRAVDLAKELGVSRQALHYHVQKLVADGQLVTRPDGTLESATP